jgi:hypothetical protein
VCSEGWREVGERVVCLGAPELCALRVGERLERELCAWGLRSCVRLESSGAGERLERAVRRAAEVALRAGSKGNVPGADQGLGQMSSSPGRGTEPSQTQT